ncbi:MAG: TetR/AcrR family transcriptional regulator [Acidimicrobiales bacterium]|nr:TetR/AcrR family transcriptional regulator [Acidimicrobiales bacterium]
MTATDTATETLTKGEQTRRTILDAAIERFGRDGFRSTSVTEIARDAGVSGTAAYAYFPNKEALFLAAVDEDAAGVIHEGVHSLIDPTRPLGPRDAENWRSTLVYALIEAVDRHPLARRLLAGLEPEVTARVIETPALNDLRKACADQLRAEQGAGLVRADLDTTVVAHGIVAIMLSLLMSVVQLGPDATLTYAEDVRAVFDAALSPPAAT